MNRIEIKFDVNTLPLAVKHYLKNAQIYDSSCSVTAQTYFIEGSVNAFLKIDKQGKLERESKMSTFLNKYGLAPKVLEYVTEGKKDYLLTEAINGEDGVSGIHLENPKKLASVFGENLKVLHAVPQERCPYFQRTSEMLKEANFNIERNSGDLDIISEGVMGAFEKLERLKSVAVDDVVLHGDYCLPNIIMQNYKFKGFIDLGYGGVGDRHYDIFWGIWTLKYNLKTNNYKDVFLDAYGRNDIDEDRLELCRVLAGLTG